jgi:hypothetical protein
MRHTVLAMSVVLTAAAATFSGATPAAAYDYAWCIQGGGWGVPGDCSYRTYAECMASAIGRRVSCNVNPRVAFSPAPPRVRRHRHH